MRVDPNCGVTAEQSQIETANSRKYSGYITPASFDNLDGLSLYMINLKIRHLLFINTETRKDCFGLWCLFESIELQQNFMKFLNSMKINYLQRIQFLKDLLGAKRLVTNAGLFETFKNLVVQSNRDGQHLLSLCRSLAVAAEQPEFVLTNDILLSHSSQASSIPPLVRDSFSSSSSSSGAAALSDMNARVRRQIDSLVLGYSASVQHVLRDKIFGWGSRYRCAPPAELERFIRVLEDVVPRCIASKNQAILLEKLLTKSFGWVSFVKFLEELSKEPDLSASTLNQKLEKPKKPKKPKKPIKAKRSKGEFDQLKMAFKGKLRALGVGSQQANNRFSSNKISLVAGTPDVEKQLAIFKPLDERLGKLMAAIDTSEALKDWLKNLFQTKRFGIKKIMLFLDAIDLEAPITISIFEQAATLQSSQGFSKEEAATDESEHESEADESEHESEANESECESDENSEEESSDLAASRKRERSEDEDSDAESSQKRRRVEEMSAASMGGSANIYRLMASPLNLASSFDSEGEEFSLQYWPKTP